MENKIIKGCGITHIALRAADIERSIKFYTEALGFTVKARWGEGDSQIALVDAGDGRCLEIFHAGVKDEKCSESKAGEFFHVAFSVESADDAFHRALEFGAEVKTAPADADIPAVPQVIPVRIAFVYGPDGETIEFFQNR
ncbi:MAG: VOC family protein [Clostridiales bacterium]|nr:VOC family protein [Clostridiales bacterium]